MSLRALASSHLWIEAKPSIKGVLGAGKNLLTSVPYSPMAPELRLKIHLSEMSKESEVGQEKKTLFQVVLPGPILDWRLSRSQRMGYLLKEEAPVPEMLKG